MRIEQVAETVGIDGDSTRSPTQIAGARGRGYVGAQDDRRLPGRARSRRAAASPPRPLLRPHTDRLVGAPVRDVLLTALEANEATGDPLPVQVHTGFGDSDLLLPAARPGAAQAADRALLARPPFVLLHCYPFVREAGWLAHVYANVFFDVSLTIPHVARPAEALYEALELAPVSKLLYASDASQTPELYLLGARWWREALGDVLPVPVAR